MEMMPLFSNQNLAEYYGGGKHKITTIQEHGGSLEPLRSNAGGLFIARLYAIILLCVFNKTGFTMTPVFFIGI